MARPQRITKEELIASAQQCIQEKGLDKLTLKAVAEGAGVTQGTVYYHFKTKEQLMLEIVRSICDASWQTAGADQQDGSRRETMVRVLEAARDRCSEKSYHTLFFSLVVHSLQNAALRDQLKGMVERENTHAAGLLARLFPELKASGPSLKYQAMMVNALIDGLALQALLDPEFEAEAVYAELIRAASTWIEKSSESSNTLS
ncbi:TetR/AcrR family transcriptional regulator [Paenibacillus lactis]|uniref:TetR/AcrR family transcriptional regulator n=1 Tax=Paenibacillus lactis TaxID=228574 RepID=UPI0011A7CE19